MMFTWSRSWLVEGGGSCLYKHSARVFAQSRRPLKITQGIDLGELQGLDESIYICSLASIAAWDIAAALARTCVVEDDNRPRGGKLVDESRVLEVHVAPAIITDGVPSV